MLNPRKSHPWLRWTIWVLSSLNPSPRGRQPLGQLLLDLFRVLTSVAERQQIVGVADQHRGIRRGFDAASTAFEVPDPGRRFHPVQ